MTESRLSRLTICVAISLVLMLTPGRLAYSQATPQPSDVTVHIVQEAETLESIAEIYGTTIQAIQQANTIMDPGDIFVGQRLIIPAPKNITPPVLTAETTVVAGLGDSLTTLAAQYDITPEELGRANKVVSPARLYAGQVLTIPPADQPDGGTTSSLARLGETDTFWKVAFRANANAVALGLMNGITNPFTMVPGSLIVLPEAASPMTLLSSPWTSLALHPLPLEQGRTGGLRLSTSVPGMVKATFLSHDIQVVSSESTHEAVFGVGRWTEPGLYPLTITLEDENGTTWTYSKDVLITNGNYASEVIRASEETSSVLSDSEAIEQEASYIQQSTSEFTLQRRWKGLFLLPVAGVLTSPFGSVRTYAANDSVTFHTGTDLAIKTGTPIYAPAGGVVVDTGQLDIRGYVTLIDHGVGVYTGYWHQASILVKPGDEVVVGQQIGTVGSTGFSTASHLHWEMWVGGVQVDPMQWVREMYP